MKGEVPVEEVVAFFTQKLPDGWFTHPPGVTVDREEILVVGELPDVEVAADTPETGRRAGRLARIAEFREETRKTRIAVALEAEARFGRKVSWGASCGGETRLFSTLSLPVMTRLRMAERAVLDTLVEAGVARSRSHALAWCVRLVGQNESEWIDRLRGALSAVEEVRADNPMAG